METETERASGVGGTVRRTAAAMGVVTLFLAVWLLLWEAFFIVLLVFSGILLGVFLDGATRLLRERSPLPRSGALTVVLLSLLAILGLGAWWMGSPLVEQLASLADRVPGAAAELRSWLSEREWGRDVLTRVPPQSEWIPRTNDVFGRVTGFFSTTIGLLTNVLIVIFLGVWTAASPGHYTRPVLRVVPPGRRGTAEDVMEALGAALRSWLGGRLASMAVVAALTAAGLFALGVPLALGLAVLAGLLSFVPFLGPVVAAVPAVLVAFVERPTLALWVVGLYVAVQLVETYFITPFIQQRAVDLPPAALLAAQILMGLMAGVLGVLLATPLLVVVVVLVQTLWVGEVLGEDVELAGA